MSREGWIIGLIVTLTIALILLQPETERLTSFVTFVVGVAGGAIAGWCLGESRR